MQRYHIIDGAGTTAGGTVTAAASTRTINGDKVAYAGDPVHCPQCNSTGIIVPDGPRLRDIVDGRQIALSDDLCRCKCSPPPRLIAKQNVSMQMLDAKWHGATQAPTAAECATVVGGLIVGDTGTA